MKPLTIKSAKSSDGFTLIELLVVIAIISLLVSILLPSLNKAKDLAKSAVCSMNLKAIGTGYVLYAEDFNMAVPGIYDRNDTSFPDRPWRVKLIPYVEDGEAPATSGDFKSRVDGGSIQVQCPAAKSDHGNFAGSSYGQVDLPANIWRCWDVSRVDDPAGTVQTVDGFYASGSTWYNWAIEVLSWTTRIQPDDIHMGSVNLLYVDSHIANAKCNADPSEYYGEDGWPDIPRSSWFASEARIDVD